MDAWNFKIISLPKQTSYTNFKIFLKIALRTGRIRYRSDNSKNFHSYRELPLMECFSLKGQFYGWCLKQPCCRLIHLHSRKNLFNLVQKSFVEFFFGLIPSHYMHASFINLFQLFPHSHRSHSFNWKWIKREREKSHTVTTFDFVLIEILYVHLRWRTLTS